MRIVDGLSADPYTTKTAALGLRVHVICIEAPRRRDVKAKRAGGEPALGLLLWWSLGERGEAYRRALVGGTIPFIRR